MIRVYGSVSLGSHSDVEARRGSEPRPRRVRLLHDQDMPHGPVKVLVRDGQVLDEPEIIPVCREDSAA